VTLSSPQAPLCPRGLFQPRHHMFAYILTNQCPSWGFPPWAADRSAHSPRQGWPLTSAPRDGTPGSRQASTAGALRSGSRCSWLVALNQMLGVKRGEPQSSAPPRYGNRQGKDPLPPPPTLPNSTQPAPRCLPESAGFAPDPPLLPLPQLSRPPGAKSWLLESMDPGCRRRDRVSSEPHTRA